MVAIRLGIKTRSTRLGVILAVLAAFAWHANVSGQIISYEGSDCFPDECIPSWTRIGTFDAQRWLQDGFLNQFVALGVWAPGPHGQFDGYTRSFADFSGSPSFFLTWRVVTDCPDSDIDGTPVSVSAWSNGPQLFHFTMTTSEVRFIRDYNFGRFMYLGVSPGWHTHYLAITQLSYVWYIDGQVVDSGTFPGPYPTPDSGVNWAARYYNDSNATKWDYIRYGVIPADHGGDFDTNGVVDQNDLYFFVDCLLGPGYDAAGPGCRWADLNGDGVADGRDIQLFVSSMLGT